MAKTFVFRVPEGYELHQTRDIFRLQTVFQLGDNPEAILCIDDQATIEAPSFRALCDRVQDWIDRVVAYESGRLSLVE